MNEYEIMKQYYNMEVVHSKKYSVGAGSDTYYVQTKEGEYILKIPSQEACNVPENEPKLCNFLRQRGVPASEFVKNVAGQELSLVEGRTVTLQKFIHGICYGLNQVPDWLLTDMAKLLGKIHQCLQEYEPLPIGIGEDFFQFMTPERALASYESSLKIATDQNDHAVMADLTYRMGLMERFPYKNISLEGVSVGNTHGDYFISQILAGKDTINGIIDWTTACRHPYVWEIFRSFVYGHAQCKEGTISLEALKRYVDSYAQYQELTKKDIEMMPIIYYYQIAVCDYYGQYYHSDAANRQIYMNQAVFSTRIMKWLENHMDSIIKSIE
ncbi:phosphotransferase enzyme family protein [Anaerosporobacter faecicola]|uniref:phosphotransferase enzyme family protein n=1 Tax=Anaerosporobacter faecicola TaxID=2718714 RepID=UPI00143BA9D2|nr:phosphotransferase [Anaerosporobacter faecicola]